MLVPVSVAWKLVFAAVLVVAIVASACARAPRRAVGSGELRRLVLCALALYAVGGAATLTDHPGVAAVVYGSGIAVAALAAWLSRGRDGEDPPDGGGNEPVDEQPPPEPDGVPAIDWARFEREFAAYARGQGARRRPPSPSGR